MSFGLAGGAPERSRVSSSSGAGAVGTADALEVEIDWCAGRKLGFGEHHGQLADLDPFR